MRRPVEVPIGGLDQPGFGMPALLTAKDVQCSQRATWGNSENRALKTIWLGPANLCCPVQVPIGGLEQPRHGLGTACAAESRHCGEGLRKRSNRRHGTEYEDDADRLQEARFPHYCLLPVFAGLVVTDVRSKLFRSCVAMFQLLTSHGDSYPLFRFLLQIRTQKLHEGRPCNCELKWARQIRLEEEI